MLDLHEARLSLIAVLAESSPSGHMGRTALMKYMYFLQTFREVPLGYRFTLYSYGPFDSDVLADLASAETLEAVRSETVLFSGGYGYEIKPGPRAKWLQSRSSRFIDRHKKDVEWVIRSFGSFNSSQLELAATIVYVDREAAQKKEKLRPDDLSKIVREIKPHFTDTQVMSLIESLSKGKLLKAAH